MGGAPHRWGVRKKKAQFCPFFRGGAQLEWPVKQIAIKYVTL